MRIHLICPVKNVTPEQQHEIDEYALQLEEEGHSVHNPKYSVNQEDDIGWRICEDHYNAMVKADRVDVFWDKTSVGSHFDLGMAFAIGMPTKVVKIYHELEEGREYAKVALEMEKRFKMEEK